MIITASLQFGDQMKNQGFAARAFPSSLMDISEWGVLNDEVFSGDPERDSQIAWTSIRETLTMRATALLSYLAYCRDTFPISEDPLLLTLSYHLYNSSEEFEDGRGIPVLPEERLRALSQAFPIGEVLSSLDELRSPDFLSDTIRAFYGFRDNILGDPDLGGDPSQENVSELSEEEYIRASMTPEEASLYRRVRHA